MTGVTRAALLGAVLVFPPGPPPRPRPADPPDEGELVVTILAKPELGEAGYEIFTMNLDGSNRRQITDNDTQEFLPHFSPRDGSRLAFMCKRFASQSLCLMNADGSGAHEAARPGGDEKDLIWGDPAWPIDDWILMTVGEDRGGDCFKVRLDKIRPDGGNRTQVTEVGPYCTSPGKEQSGDADPAFSADGRRSSRPAAIRILRPEETPSRPSDLLPEN